QPRWSAVAVEEFARMRIEGQNHRRQREILGRFREAIEHRLMAAMHAVEVTDGERNVIRSCGGKSAVDLHFGRVARLRESIEKLEFYRPGQLPVQRITQRTSASACGEPTFTHTRSSVARGIALSNRGEPRSSWARATLANR